MNVEGKRYLRWSSPPWTVSTSFSRITEAKLDILPYRLHHKSRPVSRTQAHIPSPASSRQLSGKNLVVSAITAQVTPYPLTPYSINLLDALSLPPNGSIKTYVLPCRARQQGDPCTSRSEHCILSKSLANHICHHAADQGLLALSSVAPSLHIPRPFHVHLFVEMRLPSASPPGPHRSYTGRLGRARWCQLTRYGGKFRCVSHCPSGYTIVILI